ncbi:DUF6221 family protein [Streptomyces sp. NPDC004436]
MPDLRDWITQQIDKREAIARRASKMTGQWVYALELQRVLDGDYVVANTVATTGSAYGHHIEANDPEAVLRRCAADRKILELHCYAGGSSWDQYACRGCGYDDTGWLVDHTNDCDTLLALAEGYGLTAEQQARLDRPEQERPVNLYKSYADQLDAYGRRLDDLLRPATPTSDVPAALRGPNWKGQP